VGVQRGRNSGITGAVDIPGVGAKFQGRFYGCDRSLSVGEKDRLGRASTNWKATRPLFSAGSFVASGKIRLDAFPIPDVWKGQPGTVTITHNTGVTETLPIVIVGVQFRFDEKTEDFHDITLTARLSSNPTFAGFGGTQPEATDPAPNDQEQYFGTSKAVDPQGLQSAATRRTDVWGGLDDTDSAERQRIADVIAASLPPFTGMKLRSAVFQRDSLDGGEILETWGLTDTAEDVVNPITQETVDENHLASQAQAAAINGTPSTPTGDQFVLRTETTQELNDAKELKSRSYGLLDTKEDIEFPGRVTGDDPYDLEDSATYTTVHNTSTAPADPAAPVGELVERSTVQLNRYRWKTVWTYRNLNSEQKIQFPNDVIATDPSGLEDEDRQADITNSSTVPATPAVRFTDAKLRKVISRRVGGTPEKWLHVWEFGRRTTEEDIEMPATITADDISDLQDKATITQVTASGTAPSVPAAPVGQHVRTETEQIHGSNGGKWRHTFHYANNTAEQDVEFGGTVIDDDPSDLEDVETIREVTNNDTFPSHSATLSGLVLRRQVSQRIGGTPEKWQHTSHWGARTTEQDHTFPGTTTDDDASDLIDEKTITIIDDSTPSAPSTPSGYKLVNTHFEQLTDAGKWKYRYEYKRRTNQEAIEFDNSNLLDDPSDLTDTQTIVLVQSTSVATATPPATPSGLVLRNMSSRQIHDASTGAKWRNTYEYARRTHAEDITFPGTVKQDEVSDIADAATVTLINSSSTAPATPSAPVGQLLEVRSEQLTDAGKWQHTFQYGNTTALQRIQFPTDVQDTDPSELEDVDRQSDTTSTSTPPATPATRIIGLVLRSIVSYRIAGTPEKWLHRWTFGRRSTEQDVTFPGTVTGDEVSDIADEATVTLVNESSTPPATPAAPVGQLLEVRSEQLTDAGKWKHTFRYGNTTALQRIQFPTDTQSDDPSDLEDVDRQSDTTSTSTPPVTPSPRIAGLVLREITSVRIAGTPEKWLHRWFFGRRTTEQDVTFPGTITTDDQSNIADTATITIVDDVTPSAPVTPTGMKLVDIRQEQLTDAGKYQWTYSYARRTRQEAIEFDGSNLQDDPSDLADSQTIVLVQATSVATATPPSTPSGLKLREKSSVQIHDASSGAKWRNTYVYALRNTEDDVEMPETETRVDPSALVGAGEITQVTASGTAPSIPSAPTADSKHIGTVTQQLHDGRWKHTFKYGPRTSEDDVEMPGTVTGDDPYSLADQATITQVTTSGTAPATPAAPVGELVETESEQLKDGKWRHTFKYANLNSEQRIEFPANRLEDDASDLTDEDTQSDVTDSSTPPSDPSPRIAGLKIRARSSRRVGGTPERWLHTFVFARRNTEDDIEMPGTVKTGESTLIAPEATITLVTGSGLAASAPSAPTSGTKHVSTTTVQIHDSKWKHIYRYETRTPQDAIEMDGSIIRDDVASLEDSATVTMVTALSDVPSTPTSPDADAVHTGTETQQINDNAWRHTFRYGPRTSKQAIEYDGSHDTDDPQNLLDEGTKTEVTSSATPPAIPTAPVTGTKHRETRSQRLTSGKWKHTFIYARRDSEDDVEMPASVTVAETGLIDPEGTITQVTTSGTPPATPSVPTTGTKHVRTETVQIHDTKWKHTFHYSARTPTDALEFAGTVTEDDPQGLEDSGTITDVTSSGTPPSIPAVPTAGSKHIKTVSQQLNDNRWKHTFFYGPRNSEDEVEFSGTVSDDDIANIEDEATLTVVHTSATPAAAPAAPVTGTQHVGTRTQQINDAKWKHTYRYAVLTAAERIEQAGTVSRYDPSQLYLHEETTVEDHAGTAAALAVTEAEARRTDADFDGLSVRKVTPTKAALTVRTSEEDKVWRATAMWTNKTLAKTIGSLVRVSQAISINGSLTYCKIIPVRRTQTRGHFRLRRRFVTDEIDSTIARESLIGRVNSSTFMGIPAGELMYGGYETVFNAGLGAVERLIVVDYCFERDSLEFVDDTQIDLGWIYVASSVSTGSESVSTFGWIVGGPSSSDFSVFLDG
jgi:hypothetical protein